MHEVTAAIAFPLQYCSVLVFVFLLILFLHFLFCVFFLMFLLPYSHVFVLLGLLSFCSPRSSCLFFLFFCLLCFSFFEFFLFSSFFCHMFVFLVFLHLLLPSPSCSLCYPASFLLLFSAIFLFFVLCFLSPRSFCSSRSPSPFRSQEVRSISPFFRLAILDRLSYSDGQTLRTSSGKKIWKSSQRGCSKYGFQKK